MLQKKWIQRLNNKKLQKGKENDFHAVRKDKSVKNGKKVENIMSSH